MNRLRPRRVLASLRPWRAARWQRRSVALAALVAYLLSTFGVPLPVSATKLGGGAYPCQRHACGCRSASECWDHCCCYSPREKLAWAHAHHVEPPARLAAQLRADSSREAHCHEHAAPAQLADDDGHDHEAPHQAKACCEHRKSGQLAHAEARGGVTFVPGINARKCRALADMWCATGAVLPPPEAIQWRFQWNVVEWLAPRSALDRPLFLSPPVPPPRV